MTENVAKTLTLKEKYLLDFSLGCGVWIILNVLKTRLSLLVVILTIAATFLLLEGKGSFLKFGCDDSGKFSFGTVVNHWIFIWIGILAAEGIMYLFDIK